MSESEPQIPKLGKTQVRVFEHKIWDILIRPCVKRWMLHLCCVYMDKYQNHKYHIEINIQNETCQTNRSIWLTWQIYIQSQNLFRTGATWRDLVILPWSFLHRLVISYWSACQSLFATSILLLPDYLVMLSLENLMTR